MLCSKSWPQLPFKVGKTLNTVELSFGGIMTKRAQCKTFSILVKTFQDTACIADWQINKARLTELSIPIKNSIVVAFYVIGYVDTYRIEFISIAYITDFYSVRNMFDYLFLRNYCI